MTPDFAFRIEPDPFPSSRPDKQPQRIVVGRIPLETITVRGSAVELRIERVLKPDARTETAIKCVHVAAEYGSIDLKRDTAAIRYERDSVGAERRICRTSPVEKLSCTADFVVPPRGRIDPEFLKIVRRFVCTSIIDARQESQRVSK